MTFVASSSGTNGAAARTQQWHAPSQDEEFYKDPYSHTRVSRAYEDDEVPPSSRLRGGTRDREPAPSGGRPHATYRERSASPRPSHDEYVWRSKAGGVAIFEKRPAPDAATATRR